MTKRRGMPPTAEPGMAGDFADEVGAGLHEDLGRPRYIGACSCDGDQR